MVPVVTSRPIQSARRPAVGLSKSHMVEPKVRRDHEIRAPFPPIRTHDVVWNWHAHDITNIRGTGGTSRAQIVVLTMRKDLDKARLMSMQGAGSRPPN